MTQAPQSGGGRTTAYVNKHTDQLGRLADKATDQARNVAQQVEEFANNAAQLGREAGERIQEVAGNIKGAATRAAVEEGIVTGGGGMLPKVASR
jgi:gas vesicle protein